MMALRRFAGFILAVALAACGGGGGGSSATPSSADSSTQKVDTITSSQTGTFYNLQIFLPAGYATSGRRYPVIYLADAESRFSNLSTVVDNQHRPVIVVAIWAMGNDRRWIDFTMPGAAPYYRFLTQELIPKIDAEYRTDPANRTYSGHSLSGEFAIYALYQEQPQKRYFKSFIAEEGSYWYDAGMRIGPPVGSDPSTQMEADMLARNRSLPVTLAMAGDNLGNGGRVQELYNYLVGRGYADLKIGYRSYSMGHVPMDVPAFTDALEFIFGPPG